VITISVEIALVVGMDKGELAGVLGAGWPGNVGTGALEFGESMGVDMGPREADALVEDAAKLPLALGPGSPGLDGCDGQ